MATPRSVQRKHHRLITIYLPMANIDATGTIIKFHFLKKTQERNSKKPAFIILSTCEICGPFKELYRAWYDIVTIDRKQNYNKNCGIEKKY